MPDDDESGPPSPPSAVARARRVVARPPRRSGPGPRRSGAGARSPGSPSTRPRGPRRGPPPDEPEKKSRAGRNLPAAIGVGVGLGARHRRQPVRLPAELRVHRRRRGAVRLLRALPGVAVGDDPRDADARSSPAARRCSSRRGNAGPSGLVLGGAGHASRRRRVAHRRRRQRLPRDVTASAFVLLYLPTLAGFAVLLVHADDGAARDPRVRRDRRMQRHRRLRDRRAVRQAPARADRVQGQDLGGLRRVGAGLLGGRHPVHDADVPRGVVEGPAVRSRRSSSPRRSATSASR